jgi:hypothetical protein
MGYPSRKSYPRVTMMNLDPTAQRKNENFDRFIVIADGAGIERTRDARLALILQPDQRLWRPASLARAMPDLAMPPGPSAVPLPVDPRQWR